MNTRIALIIGGSLGAGCGLALGIRKQRSRFSFRGRVVVITGGSRGLGLVMARQLAREGARLAILARDSRELQRATAQLRNVGAEVLALQCDVRNQEEAEAAIQRTADHFGALDVLINNAGVIQVGPWEHMTIEDFEEAMAIHLYGPLYCTLAAVPYMRRAGGGRIVNISSIGGKIAVPHLLPYCASKFALVGLSDGLRAELRRENILVTTVCPGLMRTGSPRNALFKGRHRGEYTWFAISDSLPLLSMNAERAARRIINATRRGAARLVLGAPAKAAVLASELFPAATATMLGLADRVLPSSSEQCAAEAHRGAESQSAFAPSWLTRLSEKAARRNNEAPISHNGP